MKPEDLIESDRLLLPIEVVGVYDTGGVQLLASRLSFALSIVQFNSQNLSPVADLTLGM